MEQFTRRMFTRIIAALARTLRDEDLSVVQVAALYLVDDRGSARISDIAEEVGRPLPSVSRQIDDLVRRKLLVREEDPDDRRARVLTLAPRGRSFVERAGAERVRTIQSAIASVSPVFAKQVSRMFARPGKGGR